MPRRVAPSAPREASARSSAGADEVSEVAELKRKIESLEADIASAKKERNKADKRAKQAEDKLADVESKNQKDKTKLSRPTTTAAAATRHR